MTDGNVNLLNYVDSRRHGRRFRELGAITQPGCEAATGPDQYGLWLDRCDQPPVPGVPGDASGIVGLRKFPNPRFDAAKWDAAKYLQHPGDDAAAVPGRHDLRLLPHRLQPDQSARRSGAAGVGEPGRHHRQPVLGRRKTVQPQHEAGRFPVARGRAPAAGHVGHVALRDRSHQQPERDQHHLQPVGQADRTRTQRDGSMLPVHHILKDGADSIGVAGASLRVYVNIGMCGDYWVTLHDPVLGIAQTQQPFDMDHARKNCEDWRRTEARMANAESFLKLMKPLLLKDAPGGAQYLTASADTLRTGRRAFAENCAQCHSSKQPPAGTADPAQWFRTAVESPDFLTDNFLSDDKRYSIMRIGTNIARVARQQRHSRQHLGQVLVRNLQGAAERRLAHEPLQPARSREADHLRDARRRPRLHPDGVADQHLGHGAVPSQQLGRRVREGSVGAGPHDGLQRRAW